MRWPSARVRDTFIQYFLRHATYPHVFVPSSSIIPKNDPSLAFVNAGMNQFKDVILGKGRPAHPRVTNTQKCLRINDLHLVGADTYHHTFFEMLGNWSFSNYFKKEACELAWDLLIHVYKLDPTRLYVTYFGGSELLPADTETMEIWKTIGVPHDRILPFGKENFWAMGTLGPCGPSTEIHYDHREGICDPTQVNKDDGVVVEIWNLVFMQYNRTIDGKLERLPMSHVVDTGAGLERLTAVLNKQMSNYDSDLFTPIFQRVHEIAKCPKYNGIFSLKADLDNSYRVFADHMRAISVALSDGILPQTNHKIRKLIHRSISVVETSFIPGMKSPKEMSEFLGEAASCVSLSLSHTFPEIDGMKDELKQILLEESERYIDIKNSEKIHDGLNVLLTSDFPSLCRISADDLRQVKIKNSVDKQMALKWYDSHGISEEMIEELCTSLKLEFDVDGLKTEIEQKKGILRDDFAIKMITNDETRFIKQVELTLSSENPKTKGGIQEHVSDVSELGEVFVEWIFDENGNSIKEIPIVGPSYVILTKTSFVPGSSNIESDIGTILLNNGCQLNVTDVKELPSGWLLHLVQNLSEISAATKTRVQKLSLDTERILGLELSAQTLYLLKGWLKSKYGVVRFNDERIMTHFIQIELTLLKGEINLSAIIECQQRLDEISFPIVFIKNYSKGRGIYDIRCATGLQAEVTTRYGCEVVDFVEELRKLSQKAKEEKSIPVKLQELTQMLVKCLNNPSISLPYDVYNKSNEAVKESKSVIAKIHVSQELVKMIEELKTINNDPFVIKSFPSNAEFTSLKKLTAAIGNKPSLVLVHSSDNYVQGRCSVPKEMSSETFTAEHWMNCVLEDFHDFVVVSAPKGKNPNFVVNLKRVRIPEFKEKLGRVMEKGSEYMSAAFLKDRRSA